MTDDPEIEVAKPGFLPIETNWFDRLFIGVVIWVALSLLWLRFLEPLGLSIWICTVISVVIAAILIRKG
jgi:predicted small integral membrane protein